MTTEDTRFDNREISDMTMTANTFVAESVKPLLVLTEVHRRVGILFVLCYLALC